MKPSPLPILSVFVPDEAPRLRMAADPVDVAAIVSPEIQTLIDQMITTMRKADGIGLAAPQIGQSLRIFVVHRSVDASLGEDVAFINPVLSTASRETVMMEEGCLSIPGVYGNVTRPSRVTLTALDRTGHMLKLHLEGLFARVAQHEVDHLNGRLFTDLTTDITKGSERL